MYGHFGIDHCKSNTISFICIFQSTEHSLIAIVYTNRTLYTTDHNGLWHYLTVWLTQVEECEPGLRLVLIHTC